MQAEGDASEKFRIRLGLLLESCALGSFGASLLGAKL